MKIGVVFPQTEIRPDAPAVRAYAQTVEGSGFSHVLAYDHVLGAGLAHRPGWGGPYSTEHQFHEVFVLFGYLAAITTRLELVTGVLILPQRQTALVAKQAAEIDRLAGGRLRLGVGAVSYTHLRAHETVLDLVCRLLLEKKKNNNTKYNLSTRAQHRTTQSTVT